MMRVLVLISLALPLGATDVATLARDLDEIARVATAMVDGDACQRIVTDRAAGYMLRTDPGDEWAAGDNYDVNDRFFIQTKKTLMRLALLTDYPVDVNLWMPVPAHASQIHVVIRNRYEMSQFWVWGALTQEMFPQMQSVLQTGKRLSVQRRPGFVSVLAPVRNSLGEIVGLIEAVGSVTEDSRENVK